MSKASEWATEWLNMGFWRKIFVRVPKHLDFRIDFPRRSKTRHVRYAWVSEVGRLHLKRRDVGLSQDCALAFARWILATFGDDQPEGKS